MQVLLDIWLVGKRSAFMGCYLFSCNPVQQQYLVSKSFVDLLNW